MDFKVIIAGSREYSDYEFLRDTCDLLLVGTVCNKKKDGKELNPIHLNFLLPTKPLFI